MAMSPMWPGMCVRRWLGGKEEHIASETRAARNCPVPTGEGAIHLRGYVYSIHGGMKVALHSAALCQGTSSRSRGAEATNMPHKHGNSVLMSLRDVVARWMVSVDEPMWNAISQRKQNVRRGGRARKGGQEARWQDNAMHTEHKCGQWNNL